MTDNVDDFDALFEEASAKRASQAPQSAPPAPSPEPDDLEALFDRIATQTSAAPATPEPPAADKPMFERLGAIARQLHDSLRQLGYDKALTEATSQISDAQDRLGYVATLTEQAANKVLNTLDQGMPAQDALCSQARLMEARWSHLFAGKMSIEEFKTLASDSRGFAQAVGEATEAEKARLLDIMMAQDFQDITGQLIKKVVAITKTVETELAELLRDHAPADVKERLGAAKTELVSGPSTPAVALSQDNVDNLLADLGF